MKKKMVFSILIMSVFIAGCGKVSEPVKTEPNAQEIATTVKTEVDAAVSEINEYIEEMNAEDLKATEEKYKPLRDTTVDDVYVTDTFMTYFYPFVKDGILRTWNGAETYFNNNGIDIDMIGLGTAAEHMSYENEDGDSIYFSFDKKHTTQSKIEQIIYHREELNADLCWFPKENIYTFSIVGAGNKTKLNTFGEALTYMFDPKETEVEQ